ALVQQVRPAIIALIGAVVCLLLISCANVANLLLVRASLRSSELTVRSALGAGRWRIVQQLLAEAVVLTAAGTALGVALAWIGIHELLAIAPVNLPRLDAIRLDPLVFGFAATTGLLAAVLFGMVPARDAFQLGLMNGQRGSSRTSGLGSG